MVNQVIRFSTTEDFRIWQADFETKEASLKTMGLMRAPIVYSNEDNADEISVILEWSGLKEARNYITNAHFVVAKDEGVLAGTLQGYISNSHLLTMDASHLKAVGGHVRTFRISDQVRDSITADSVQGTMRATGMTDTLRANLTATIQDHVQASIKGVFEAGLNEEGVLN
ncbi:MAG: hypothetical protein IH840_10130, partial [Candidatus Heimdallarchaeota archaeon]|nr:hypothetical protein [Candidatus Heimdallarchaeota archaeon]